MHVAVAVLLVSVFGLDNAADLFWIGLSAAAFVLVFEHLLPYLIVRRESGGACWTRCCRRLTGWRGSRGRS